MLKCVFISIFLFFISACTNDGISAKVEMSVTPEQPFVILTNYDFLVGYDAGTPIIEEIIGPWSYIGFKFVNKHTEVITVIAASFLVTGPDGKTRTAVNFNDRVGADDVALFSSIKPVGDQDCDGLDERVFDNNGDEIPSESKEGPAPATCDLDQQNMSFTGQKIYLSSLLEGIDPDNFSDFENGTYSVVAKFEGWVGAFDNPKSNFIKEITFQIITN